MQNSLLKSVSRKIMKNIKPKYEEVYQDSLENPEGYWARLGKLVSWYKSWDKVMDNFSGGFTKWFVGGKLNACYNCLDRHIEAGKGNNIAFIYDGPLIEVTRKITYNDMYSTVSRLAGCLIQLGVKKGDIVLIYMPLIPETAMAMLACARIGAIHSVVFGGFAAGELCERIQHCQPKVIISASCGIEPNKIINYVQILDDAISISTHIPSKCIIFQRDEIQRVSLDPDRDLDWAEAIKNSFEQPCIPVDANDILYILYTSGTTGEPKGIERPVGGHLVTLTWSMKAVYNMDEQDVWWATSDFGWVLGHSYMCYAPLLCGITSVMYEGKPTNTPDPGQYYRVIHDYKVKGLFTIPTVMRLLKQVDPTAEYKKKYDTSSLKYVWLGGEHCDITTKIWTEEVFKVPVNNHWWQTETGSPVTVLSAGMENPCTPTKFSIGLPAPGYRIEILRKDGSQAEKEEMGEICLRLPLPPGVASCFYKAPERFLDTYFTEYPGYFDTKDIGYIDDDGLVYIVARSDDVINVAGHRLSTIALEDIVLSHPDVCNACVVSVPDFIKNEVPFCLYVIREESTKNPAKITQEILSMVRGLIGPVACFNFCAPIRALPMTISGKICRKSISDLANNNLTKISPTVLDKTIYEDIKKIFNNIGIHG